MSTSKAGRSNKVRTVQNKQATGYFNTLYIILFAALVVINLGFTFLVKPSPEVLRLYHITTLHYWLLVIPIALLLLVVWLTSLYASLNIKSYATRIRGSADGRAFGIISNGFVVLTLSMPITSVIGNWFGVMMRHHIDWRPTLTIISNYLALALALAAFALIAAGATKLSRLLANRRALVPKTVWVLVFIIASVFYGYFILSQSMHAASDKRAYYLPDLLLISTIAIPYLFTWFLGLSAAHDLISYHRWVRGRLYRSGLSYLGAGITVVVLSSVATRVLTSLSTRLSRLALTPILFILYGLLLAISVGYILIAIGSKKLRKIEEV